MKVVADKFLCARTRTRILQKLLQAGDLRGEKAASELVEH